jgi:lysophospholipase
MDDTTKLLIINTGGTIGMELTERGYVPVQGLLAEKLSQMPQFQDPKGPPCTTPRLKSGKRVSYYILEYEPLMDSSNMKVSDWVQIAQDIKAHYEQYDGFVILHGTDTMAYTASALSFMLEGLSKIVILTGSQIPLSHVRNDAMDNLLGAVTIAGQHLIPEVCVYFHNKLMRGNRVRKVDASDFDAFESFNLSPLVRVGVDIRVSWHRIRSAGEAALNLQPIGQHNIAFLRLFPGITMDMLRNILISPLQGLIVETYGTGNAPDNRPDLLRALKEACRRGVVIVNCTQCLHGAVSGAYAGGKALAETGVISGGDMTPEAAITKLAYLFSRYGGDSDRIRDLMVSDLRGEITLSD